MGIKKSNQSLDYTKSTKVKNREKNHLNDTMRSDKHVKRSNINHLESRFTLAPLPHYLPPSPKKEATNTVTGDKGQLGSDQVSRKEIKTVNFK